MAGRTNSSNVTAEETGLPGRPNSRTGAPPPGRSATPNANGLPGWTATRQRSIRPIASMAVLTTSYGPTDTPPDTISASAPVGQAAPEPAEDVVEVVDGDPEVDRLGARGGDVGTEPGAVGVRDPGRAERLARRPDLVARGKDRDPRPAMDQRRPRRPSRR